MEMNDTIRKFVLFTIFKEHENHPDIVKRVFSQVFAVSVKINEFTSSRDADFSFNADIVHHDKLFETPKQKNVYHTYIAEFFLETHDDGIIKGVWNLVYAYSGEIKQRSKIF